METITETRYQRALKRNIDETGRAILERKAMIGLEVADTYHSMDFIGLSYDALFNDMIAHAIKVLENRKGDASFWYIYNCQKDRVDNFVQQKSIDFAKLQSLTEKLKHIRDKTHFHIDRDAVKAPEKVWDDAGVKGSELARGIDDLWVILNYLYKIEFKMNFPCPDYNGNDAIQIAKYAQKINKNL